MRRRTGAVPVLAAVLLLTGCVTSSGEATGVGPVPSVSATPSASGVGTSVHLTAAGDYGEDPALAGGVLDALGRAGQQAHLALGDLSYGKPGGEGHWCDFVTARIRPGLPFELVSGNHESNGPNGNIDAFAACLPNRVPGLVGTYGREYYVDLPRDAPLVRVVMVSPGLTFEDRPWDYARGSAHYDWTARAIDGARSSGIPWVVVGMHKPCLSIGKYACDIGADLLHLLVDRRVDLVLSGHEHLYQRTKQLAEGPGCVRVAIDAFRLGCVVDRGQRLSAGAGTVFVTAGTGGAALRPASRTDPEAGYFTASAYGSPAHGYLDVRATRTELRVSFVRSSDGSTADSFLMSR